MTLQRLSEHVVWMRPGPPDRPSLCAVTGTRGTLMLDSGASDAHARLFLEGLDALDLPRPRLTALTHWHWDHVFGAVEVGAPVIAHRLTAQRLDWLAGLDWDDPALDARVTGGDEIAFCADNLKLEMPAPRSIRVAQADIVFHDALVIDLGGVTCRLQHVGGDHSADSVVAWVEPDRLLFVSDCLYDNIYAPTRHYTTARLFPLLDMLEAFAFALAVEGHQDIMHDRAGFQAWLSYLRNLGRLADSHPGDAAAISAAWAVQLGRALTEDDDQMIRAFADAPRAE